MDFKGFWRLQYTFEKTLDRLSQVEIVSVREDISRWKSQGRVSSEIIKKLAKKYPKLAEKYKAERAYNTEVKSMATIDAKENAEIIGVKAFKVITGPNACQKCRDFADAPNGGIGRRIFKTDELRKNGRTAPPVHPNCYCMAVVHE
jgi:hypothetical protein